jgi:hypothetical protein
MSRTRRHRHLLAPLFLATFLATFLALAGCSSDEPSSGDSGDAAVEEAENTVTALGISFEAPAGWESLDPDEADIPDAEADDLAEGLGLTTEQFEQTIRNVDLFLVDGDGPEDGFLDNINVIGQTGTLPGDAELESQFAAIGADVIEVTHEDTPVGEAAVVEYSLDVGDRTIEGVSYLVTRAGDVVTVTVSTPDRAESDDISATILDTLAEAS